nr:MAG TPA_asm: hypothetical protein [Bacteriophage sp.]
MSAIITSVPTPLRLWFSLYRLPKQFTRLVRNYI